MGYDSKDSDFKNSDKWVLVVPFGIVGGLAFAALIGWMLGG